MRHYEVIAGDYLRALERVAGAARSLSYLVKGSYGAEGEELQASLAALEQVEYLRHRPERWGTEDKMLWVEPNKRENDDPAFRCECGGNVFRESLDRPLHYKCNSCSATFTAEA